MALQSFEIQVLDSIGDTLAGQIGLDTEMLDDFGTQVIRDILTRLPVRLLWSAAAETELAAASATQTTKVLGVTRLNKELQVKQPAREIPFQLAGRAANQDDIEFALPNDPVFYFQDKKIYVLPAPTSSATAYISAVAYPLLDASTDIAITGFPDELEGTVVIGIVVMVKIREAGLARRDAQTEIEAITDSGHLASFEGALPTFIVPAAPSLPTLTLSTMAAIPVLTLSGAQDTWPTLTLSPSIALPTLSLPSMTALPTYSAAVIDTDIGTLSLTKTITSPGTLTISPMDGLPADLAESSIDFSGITAPSYAAPTIGTAIGTLAVTKTITDPGTLTMPTVPTLPSLSLTGAPAFSELSLPVAPSGTIAYTSAGAAPSSTVTPPADPAYSAAAVFSYSGTVITNALDKARDLIDDATGMSGGDDIEAHLVADDLELASTQTKVAAQEISRANSAIQDELTKLREYEAESKSAADQFNAEVSLHSANIQEEVAEVDAGIKSYLADVQDNKNTMDVTVAQYQGDIQKYAAEAKATTDEWTAEESQFKLGKWKSQVDSEIQEHQTKVDAAIKDYSAVVQSNIGEYQANVDRQIKEFTVELQADTAEWTEQKKADLEKFRADTQEAIQSYQTEIAEYTADVRKLIDQYQAERGIDISLYSATVEKVLGKFQRDNEVRIAEYRANTDRQIREFEAELAADTAEWVEQKRADIANFQVENDQAINSYRVQADAFIQEHQVKTQSLTAEYQTDIDAQIKQYSAIAGSEISEYSEKVKAYLGELQALRTTELSEYQSKVDAVIKEFTASTQSELSEFTAKVGALLNEYQALSKAEAEAFASNLSKARSYLEEAQLRLGAMAGYAQNGTSALQDVQLLKQQYEAQITNYIGAN